MKWLLGTVATLALAWSAFWGVSAWQARAAAEAWFEERAAAGWQAEYTDLRVAGFPNRVDLTIEGLALTDPDRGLAWRAPVFQAMQLVYRPGHLILAFAEDQVIETRGARYDVTADGLRASLAFAADGRLVRAGFEAAVLNVDGPRGTTALAGLLGGVAATGAEIPTYQLGMTADAAAGSGSGVGDGLAIRADLGFDAPWRRDAPERPTPQPTAIDLERAEYRTGDVWLRLAGAVEINERGAPSGEATLRAENWRAALDAAVSAGQIPQAFAEAAGDMLGLVAGLSGSPESLDLPLRFRNGQIWLGPVPVGAAPVIRLP
jgi:hypothetical protein